jgi:hypothetical protein
MYLRTCMFVRAYIFNILKNYIEIITPYTRPDIFVVTIVYNYRKF